jgi:hypothetical protein
MMASETIILSPQPLDVNQWLERVRTELEEQVANGCDAGTLEALLEQRLRELGLPLLGEALQKLADRQALCCPQCGDPLQVERHGRVRHVFSVFGKVPFRRSYGFCLRCGKRFYPADSAMGLQERAPASPRVQEICALMVLESPAGQAEASVRRLTGLELSSSSMHREALRQGERALHLRDADVALTGTPAGIAELARRAQAPKNDFTLVIEIDAWNIRERDHWGQSEKLRKQGETPARWHWVYTGTIFRLDQRGTTESGRSVITERGYVATRQGLESFEKQLYAEALQRGLAQAQSVLVVADGAVWIWNLAGNRFKEAAQRVDYWHVSEHLWSVAHDLFGQGTHEARQWVGPLLRWLKQRNNGALDVISTLQELRADLAGITAQQTEMLDREIKYLEGHKNRMDYKQGKALDQPLGSGAIESTCAQYQCRFKRTGQFWSLEGDEAFLALASLHRNGRWCQLFPHDCRKE